MKKTIEYFIKALIYATFFVPVVVVPSSFIFPFIVPKILLFRSLVLFALGGYILLLFINWQEYKPRSTPLNIAVLIFLFSFAISTFVGVDAYHSFWDNHERMLGLFTILHYVLYYFICSAVFKNWTEWKWALRIFLLAGSIVMFIGVLQKSDPFLLLNQGSNRVSSTLGNAIYVGGYGLFLFFVSLLLIIKEKSALWKWAAALSGLLAMAGLIFSGTRGSLLGLMVGVVGALIAYAIFLKDQPRTRMALRLALALFFLILGALYLQRQKPFVQAIPVLGTLLNSSLTTGTGNTRLIAWNIAVKSWKERPFFGWGPNNFFYAFNQYYNPHSLDYGYGETWFDNAHNIFLNTLTVQGIFGLLAYLFIFITAIMILWRDKDWRQKNIHLMVIGSAFLVAHLAQNATVFENPTSYLYFVFWLAMVNRLSPLGYPSLNNKEVADGRSPKSPLVSPAKAWRAGEVLNPDKRISWGLVSVVGAASFVLVFIFNIQSARANQKTLEALARVNTNLVAALPFIQEALKFNSPHIDDIRGDLSRVTIQALGSAYRQLGRNENEEIIRIISSALQKNAELHPMDIRTYISFAQLYQIAFMISNNPQYVVEAEKTVETALRYSPRRQQLRYMLATFKLQLGKGDEAIKLLEETMNDDPKISETYWRLAYLYQLLGQTVKAKEIIFLAKQRNIVFTDQGSQVEALIMSDVGAPLDKNK